MERLFRHRKQQLVEEGTIDSSLFNLMDECPKTVSFYLLSRREENRKQYLSNLSYNIFSLYKNSEQNMREIDKHQEKILRILKNENLCLKLKELNKGKENGS